ncbi:MAG: nickel-dependent hydrogenase large subunit, partial [Elusimicrobiota bacterium]
MGRKISINPITRLEGHGKIDIFLNDSGNVDKAYLQVPELRAFEVFAVGRPAEEMPRITPKICGVCPTAHHICSAKALDKLFNVEPTEPAKKIRELMYCAFMMESHAIHFFFLGGPDFVVGPQAPGEERNILGVLNKVGKDAGLRVIKMRKRLREVISCIGGRVIHPVCGLPGGVSRRIKEEERKEMLSVAKDAVEFAKFSLEIFNDIILKNEEYVNTIMGDVYRHET